MNETNVKPTKSPDANVKIFESNPSGNCDDDQHKGNINCVAVKRMCVGLKYYQALFSNKTSIKMTEQETKDMFLDFNETVYGKKQLLDDSIHIIKKHNGPQQLIDMQNEVKTNYNIQQCSISKCNALKRHYRPRGIDYKDDNESKNNNEQDLKYQFFCDSYHKIHHQIFHLFEMGLRCIPNDNNNQEIKVNEDDIDGASLIDKEFKNKRDILEKQKKQCKIDNYMERYTGQNNKFTMQIDNTKNEKESENTFLDGMLSHMEEENEDIGKAKEYFDENEFDSDAVKADLEDAATSNICKKFGYGIGGSGLMFQYARTVQLSALSFSTGYIFFYWNYWKKLSKEEIEKKDAANKHTLYNGHSAGDLLISGRYGSLKEEILASGYVTQEQWNENLAFKAMEYLDAEKVKKIKCKSGYNAKYHDLVPDTAISFVHLCAVILYCDITALCTAFSATFRKKSAFETLKKLKKRHEQFAHFAKALVEAVNDFGISGDKQYWDDEKGDLVDQEYGLGPFFTGLSCVLSLPAFAMTLKAPCSTSMCIEISLNFAKRAGCVLAFQNDVGDAVRQSFFDTSWISAYFEENERLFVAGKESLRLASVHIIESAKNFKKLCKGLFILDMMLSGDYIDGIKISRSDVSFLEMVMNSELKIGLKKEINEKYIKDSFDLFAAKKTQITLCMYCMDAYFKDLSHLIFHSVGHVEEPEDNKNVIKARIFSIFPRLKQVVIDDTWGKYIFNWLEFLGEIQTAKSSIKYRIKVRTSFKNYGKYDISEKIKKAFCDKKWNIQKETEVDFGGKWDIFSVIFK